MGRITVNSHVATAAAPRRLTRATAAVCGAAALALLGGAANSQAADQCANADIRAAQGAAHLPDCRAYEWISWDNPGGNLSGVDVQLKPMQSWARADGDKLLYFATSQLGERTRGIAQLHHFGERTAHGWTSRPAVSLTSPDAITDTLVSSQFNPILSADGSAFGFWSNRTFGPPNPLTFGGSVYVSSGVGTERWVSAPEPGLTSSGSTGVVIGGTPDFSTVYLTSDAPLTTQAGDSARSGVGIYEYRDGVLRSAGVLPDGTVPPGGVLPAGGATAPGGTYDEPLHRRNQVSADGRRVFFTATVGGGLQLYVREDGARTRLLSHALGAPTAPSAQGVRNLDTTGFGFVSGGHAFATADGTRTVFLSRDVLASGAESAPADDVKAYRADVATGALTYLPEVRGAPLALDDDASRILWLRVDPGASRSIMLWDEQSGTSNAVDGARPQAMNEIAWIGMTADGSVTTLQSTQPLDPAFPDTNGRSQVYRWTIGDAAPRCLSCRIGVTYGSHANLSSFSTSPTEFATETEGFTGSTGQLAPRAMSADGRRVVFDTRTALVEDDQNGVRDVYVWEEGRGVALLSSGTSDKASWFADASESGDDVFIVTAGGLDPADRDGSYDVYDVRVGGGFAATPVTGCDGDGCQPPVTPGAPPSGPGSDQIGSEANGPDDIAPSPAQLSVKRVTRDRTGATLKIATSTAGTVRISGARVAAVRRTVARKGSLTVRLRPTRAARRTLTRRGKLAVTVRVQFAPRTGKAVATTVRTTIKRKR